MLSVEYLRSFKIGQYAIFDILVSFLSVYLLAPLLSKLFKYAHLDIPKSTWLYFTLPLSVIFHILVSNFTPLTKYILDINGHYTEKISLIILVVIGIRHIKIIKKRN